MQPQKHDNVVQVRAHVRTQGHLGGARGECVDFCARDARPGTAGGRAPVVGRGWRCVHDRGERCGVVGGGGRGRDRVRCQVGERVGRGVVVGEEHVVVLIWTLVFAVLIFSSSEQLRERAKEEIPGVG
jgi:hypothetical protein